MPHRPEQYLTETINVEKLIPGGLSLGTLASGKKIMLWGALPGEVVTKCQITKNKSSYTEGTTLEYRNPSPFRVAPRDVCYLATSPWQIMDYEYELEQKKILLVEIFSQQKLTTLPDQDLTVATDKKDFYYRNKMEYSLYYAHEDQKIHLAFRARGSHRKIICDHSSLEHPEIWSYAREIVDQLNAKHAEARNYQSLLLRSNQNGEVSGGLYENHRPHPDFPTLHDTILGHDYSYSPNGFFQINLPVYEMALSEIRQHIKTHRVLDLYAGVGTIGLSVARDKELVLVECDGSAFQELRKNCSGTLAQPIHARSEDALEYIEPDQTVIVDPPRAGCDAKLIEKLLEIMPPSIIYLSCNPITQARDARMLEGKYHITKVQPYNFFPHTPHLENLMVLELNA